MTPIEKRKFEKFESDLRNYPVKRMMFFANISQNEDKDYKYAEQKAICEHLGIEFREEDFAVDEVAEAKEWASQFPDIE